MLCKQVVIAYALKIAALKEDGLPLQAGGIEFDRNPELVVGLFRSEALLHGNRLAIDQKRGRVVAVAEHHGANNHIIVTGNQTGIGHAVDNRSGRGNVNDTVSLSYASVSMVGLMKWTV